MSKKSKEKDIFKNIQEKIKEKPIILSLPIIILIIILFVVTLNPFSKELSNKIIVKEITHEIKNDQITITYTIENDKAEDFYLDSIFVDLKNEDGKVIGGYLQPVGKTFASGEKQQYTLEKTVPTTGQVHSLSFRCDEC